MRGHRTGFHGDAGRRQSKQLGLVAGDGRGYARHINPEEEVERSERIPVVRAERLGSPEFVRILEREE